MIHSVIGIMMLGIIICHGSCTPEAHTVRELEEPVVSTTEESSQENKDEAYLETAIKDDNSDASQETVVQPMNETVEESMPEESVLTAEPGQSGMPDSEKEKPSEPEESQSPEIETEEQEESEEAKEPEEPEQPEESAPAEESQTVSEESEHVHEWIPITEIIHHEAVYETVPVYEEQQILDAETWDEEVMTGEYIYSCLCCSFETDDIEELGEHCITEDHNYWCRPLTETVHHEAEYHTEKVKVGEKEVLVTEAWDEEIITGYRCSGCGATKE